LAEGSGPAGTGGITPEQIAEQIRKLKVSDLLLAETSTLAQVAYAKLGERDLEQARLAIDALRALVPVLGEAIPQQAHRDFQQVVTNLQLAYASAASQPQERPERPAGEPEQPAGEPEQPEEEEQAPAPATEDEPDDGAS